MWSHTPKKEARRENQRELKVKIGCRRGKRTAVHPKRKAKRISKENSKRKLGVTGEKELSHTQKGSAKGKTKRTRRGNWA